MPADFCEEALLIARKESGEKDGTGLKKKPVDCKDVWRMEMVKDGVQ
jgi:hypothetical protein